MTIINVNNITGINSISAQSNSVTFYDSAGGTASVVAGLTGNVNSTGISTFNIIQPTDIRVDNISEKLKRINGNTVAIAYNSGEGNIGLCTNPTGDITVNVTGIPTDSSFDNHTIVFSVIVNQTGTARTCTAVTLNGVTETIRWSGGSLSSAVGTATTLGYDIFSFTGINTVGSASTTTNYEVLGVVNGGFR